MKIYVDVIVYHYKDGKIKPLQIIWEDDRRFEIDKIIDIRPAASLKAGGVGIRYTVIVESKQKYLFLEENKWFVEGRD